MTQIMSLDQSKKYFLNLIQKKIFKEKTHFVKSLKQKEGRNVLSNIFRQFIRYIL
jgi:hypothetical protein